MTLRIKTCLFLAVLAAIACSQHNPDGPGAGDFTPPGVASVVAWDKYHVIVTFNERVSRETAENAINYQLGAPSGPKPRPVSIAGVDSAYGVYTAALHEDNLTVTLTTDSLSNSPYALRVVGVADLHGNAIPGKIESDFEGTNGADVTPPEIVLRSPEPDDTHASTGGFIVVGFSEPVTYNSFTQALQISGDAQRLSIRSDDLLHYYCDLSALLPNTDYTVSVNGARDMAGNAMPETQWTFRTDKTADTAAPTVISSRPANNDVNVSTATPLSFSFSEPVDPYSLIVRPHVNVDAVHWTNGGRKVTFETTWLPGRQYTIQIRPGEMRDLAGNRSTSLYTLVFSTGAELAQGSFSGSIGGDPASTSAKNASGALVFAGPTSPYDLYTSVAGTVGIAGAFELTHVAP
jgi:Bacterial Ig-like domain